MTIENTDSRLRLLVERIERLDEEKKAIAEDIKDAFQEAKSIGYDLPALKEVLKRRKKKREDVTQLEMFVQTYECALGMV